MGGEVNVTLPSALKDRVWEIEAMRPLPKYSPEVPSGSGALDVGKTAVLPHSAWFNEAPFVTSPRVGEGNRSGASRPVDRMPPLGWSSKLPFCTRLPHG